MASCLAAASAAAFAWSVCRAAYQSRPLVAPSATLATRTTAARTQTILGVTRRTFGILVIRAIGRPGGALGELSVSAVGATVPSPAFTALPAWVVIVLIEQPPS